MDRERLARLLEEPGKVAREDIADLKALTEQFPWFSGAHLLRALGERSSGDVMAEETLKVSAAHVPSRAVLYDLRDMSVQQAAAQLKQFSLTRSAREEVEEDVAEKSVQDPIAKQPVEEKPAIVEKKKDPATDEIVAPPAKLPIVKAPVEEPITNGEPIDPITGGTENVLISDRSDDETSIEESEEEPIPVEEIPLADKADKVELEQDEEIDQAPISSEDPIKEELDRQIMEAAIASAYDLTWQEDVASRAPLSKADRSKRTPERVSETEAKGSGSDQNVTVGRSKEKELEIPSTAEAVDQQPEIRPIEKEPVAVVHPRLRSKLKFTDWLSIDQPLPPNSDQAPEAEVAPPSEFLDLGMNEPAEPIPSPPISDPALDPTELIDRFIEHENPAPVRKAEFFTPQQAAKKSLDDSAGIVSETLARIYEKQGNFAKALEAYRKLALKYPEKSSYFAGLSRILEEKLNA